MNMLGGGQSSGSGMAGQSGGMGGGLGGLLSNFQQARPGGAISPSPGWAIGPNQPVSPQQLQTVLGDNQVQGMASQAGMGSQGFSLRLQPTSPQRGSWHDAEWSAA